MMRRYEGIRGIRGVAVAVHEGDKTIAITGPFRTWADAEQWEREQEELRMSSTLVDLKTLHSLAKIAKEHGTSEHFMDMALEFAAASETHITHLEGLLEGLDIKCSCESMLLVDVNCLLHGYVELSDQAIEAPGDN